MGRTVRLITLVIIFASFSLSAAFAAPTTKNTIPNLVGNWKFVSYDNGRVYDYPFQCIAIESQNGNLFQGTFYWWDSEKTKSDPTACYDLQDPVSCENGTVTETVETTRYEGKFSGSINANQVMLYGEVNVTKAPYNYDVSKTAIGLYDQATDTISGFAHISLRSFSGTYMFSSSNETRGFKFYSRGAVCPMVDKPESIRWMYHYK